MIAVSLFDGMSCLMIALKRLGVSIDKYYASEVDPHCIKLTKHRWPNIIHLGDVSKIKGSDIGFADLLAGGSPCQGLSRAGLGLGFEDPRSVLFYQYIRLLKELREYNPDIKFLLENVRMDQESELIISRLLGVNPILINSSLVSAQNRERLYWTNIGMQPAGLFGDMQSVITQPKDKGILLKDILEEEVDQKYYLSDEMLNYLNTRKANFNSGKVNYKFLDDKGSCINASSASLDISDNIIVQHGQRTIIKTEIVKIDKDGFPKKNQDKAGCLTAGAHSGGNHSDMDLNQVQRKVIQINESKESGGQQPQQQNRVYSSDGIHPALMASLNGRNNVEFKERIRRLTPKECLRLQTCPDDYFDDVKISDTQKYRMTGNGWTVDVICHILKYML